VIGEPGVQWRLIGLVRVLLVVVAALIVVELFA
jgi:hypothetical protein